MTTEKIDIFDEIRVNVDDAEAMVMNPIWVKFKQKVLQKIAEAEQQINEPLVPAEVQKWFLGQLRLLREFKYFIQIIQEATKFDRDEGYDPTPEDVVEQIETMVDNFLLNDELKEDTENA